MRRLNWLKVIMTVGQERRAAFQCVFVRTLNIAEAVNRAAAIVKRKSQGRTSYPYCVSYSSPQADGSSLEVCNDFGDRLDLDRFWWRVTTKEPLPFETPDGIIFNGNDPKGYHDHLANRFSHLRRKDHEEIACCLDRERLAKFLQEIWDVLPEETPRLLVELIPNNRQAPKALRFLNDAWKSRSETLAFLRQNSRATLSNGMVALKLHFLSADVLLRITDHKLVIMTSTNASRLEQYCHFLRSRDILPVRKLYRIDDRIGHFHYQPMGVNTFSDLPATLRKAGFKAIATSPRAGVKL